MSVLVLCFIFFTFIFLINKNKLVQRQSMSKKLMQPEERVERWHKGRDAVVRNPSCYIISLADAWIKVGVIKFLFCLFFFFLFFFFLFVGKIDRPKTELI